jgi:hypothetical protein
MESKVSAELWASRIEASRQRRDEWIGLWSEYARLHTNAYLAARGANDEKTVYLPSGDQVKLGLVHRNVEQTMAILEVPEIGVRVMATDYARELSGEDTHREGVVEAALVRSLKNSGFCKGSEEVDHEKRDGVVIGHGINYSYWRQVEREIDAGMVPVIAEQADGSYLPALDAAGQPQFAAQTERRVVWENVQDEHVSPLEFLFDGGAKALAKAAWHGMEKIVSADALRDDPGIAIPAGMEPTSFIVRDLYGDTGREQGKEDNCYRKIVIWDKANYELLTFLEGSLARAIPAKANAKKKRNPDLSIHLVKVERWPLTFDNPDDSPFSFFVPLPANDFPWGISQVEHIKNPSSEADKTRTRLANAVRQTRRIPWYRKGALDPVQLAAALNGTSGDPVGLDFQEGQSSGDIFGELPVPGIDPDLYEASKQAEETVRWTSGVSEVPYGGAGTATESENIMAVGGARSNRKRRRMLAFYTDVARKHKDFRREFDPPGQTISVVGPDGVPLNLVYGREAFQGALEVEVLPGGDATTVSPVKQKMVIETGNLFLGRFSPQFDRIFARQVLTLLDFRDVNAMLQAIPADGSQYLNAMSGVDGRARADSFRPGDQSDGQAIRAAVNAGNEGRIA